MDGKKINWCVKMKVTRAHIWADLLAGVFYHGIICIFNFLQKIQFNFPLPIHYAGNLSASWTWARSGSGSPLTSCQKRF
jgi:hypothetical protein